MSVSRGGICMPLLSSIGLFQRALLNVNSLKRFNSNSKSRWLQRQNSDHFTREAKIQNLRSRAAYKLMEIDDKYHLFKKEQTQRILDLGFAPGSWSNVARRRTNPHSMILGVDILPCEPPQGVSSLQANILSKKTQELIRLYFSKHYHMDKILNDVDNIHGDHGFLKPNDTQLNHPINTISSEINDDEIKDNQEYKEIFTPEDKSHVGALEELPIDIILSDMLMNTSGVAVRDHLLSVDLCDAALVTTIDLLRPAGSFVCKLYTGFEDKLFEKRLRKVFKRVVRFKPVSSRSESKEIYFIGLNKLRNIDKLDVFT